MFFNSCSYKNSCFSELAYDPSVHVLQFQRCSQTCWLGFCAFAFEGFLLVYIAYPCRFATNALLFTSKILVFEKVSYNIALQRCSCEMIQNIVCLWLENPKIDLKLIYANTLEYWVKYFLHKYQKILKYFLLKSYTVI